MHADVLIAGLGPVGQLLANLLGARGVRVVAVDPAHGPSALPRSATADEEVLRILQAVGLDEAVRPWTSVQPRVSFVAASGRRLTLLEPGAGPGVLGHPPLVAWHQPDVERVLCAGLARFASVEVRWGRAVAGLADAAQGAGVGVSLDDGSQVSAGWVVACDGASSVVRRLRGIGFGGSTFAQPWLVVDGRVGEPGAPSHLPDHVHFLGDPRRPGVSLPMAPGRHRWELMSSASEDHAALASAAAVARVTGPGVAVERSAVYEFHARTAARWRDGRVLLAGDAAHVMPPFAGQGFAAGARDVANLAWKLDAVVRGAPAALLDTYEAERRPDVRAATRVAIGWGRLLQTRRRRLARVRDAVLFAIDPTPLGALLRRGARARPPLRRGALLRPRRPGTGALFPQPGRLDDALGPGWAVVGTVSPEERAAWERLGARVLAGSADPAVAAWLRDRRAAWAAIRPDRVVFGTGPAGSAGRAAEAAAAWLGHR